MQTNIPTDFLIDGHQAGPQVESALYWATKVSTNLAATKKYDHIRNLLQSLIWNSFRVLGRNAHVISKDGIEALNHWAIDNLCKLSEKQKVDAEQFASSIEMLLVGIKPN